MSRPSTIVISDWLMNCRTNQWTPFEAATALKVALEKEGYEIVEKSTTPRTARYRRVVRALAAGKQKQ